MNNIDNLINVANAKAGEVANNAPGAQPGTAVAPVQSTGGAVATLGPAPALTLHDMASGSVSVDAYAKLSFYGFTVGDNPALFEKVRVKVVPSEIFPHKAVRKTVGSVTTYARSADGVRDMKTGEAWTDVIARFRKEDPRCTGDYDAFDIPFTILDDLVCPKTNKVVLEAGKRLGYTTPITGSKVAKEWNKKVLLQQPSLNDAIIGTIYHEPRQKDANKWGIFNFGELPESWVPEEEYSAAA